MRALVVIVAFCVAVGITLAVLFSLGALWVGDELRAAAPDDPQERHNLIDERSDVSLELHALLLDFLTEHEDLLPLPPHVQSRAKPQLVL